MSRRSHCLPAPACGENRPCGHSRVSLLLLLVIGVFWARRASADTLSPLTGHIWIMWGFSPVIVGGCLLVLIVYLRGFSRRHARGIPVSLWRAASYVTGIVLTYIVLESPIDALADHVFWIHRVQHVALHHWIPMLLALSAPAPELVSGLPHWARKHVLRHILRNKSTRKVGDFVQHPIVAPLLFVGLIYLWLTPAIFDYATTNEGVHDVMHFSMLIEGIPFWWLMLDPKPGRVEFKRRIIILWVVMFPQILIGAYIALTSNVLYPIYAMLDQGWVSSYRTDQCLGGLVVWIPTSMMSVISAVIVLRFWARYERYRGRARRVYVMPALTPLTTQDNAST